MKKIIFFVLCVLTCVSCNNIESRDDNHIYEEKYDPITVKYHNHTYIIFRSTDGNISSLHDPDCICFKNKK